MRFLFCRAMAALTLWTGLSGLSAAASFQITGVVPVAAVQGVSPPALTATFAVLDPGTSLDWTAALEGNPAWASLGSASGRGAGSLTINFATTTLVPGTYSSALLLNSGGTVSRQAFTVTVILPNVVKMEADLNRPMIYALHRNPGGSPTQAGYLLFLDTNTEKVENVIPVGTNPTDLDISYAEGVIYVTNHGAASRSIRVINPVTAREVRTLEAGNDVFKINAGKSGRLVTEGLDQWITVFLRNSTTGASIVSRSEREGDGEFDPSGRYYYRSDNNISNAHLTRYDLLADAFASPVEGVIRAFGSRNLIMSGDGSRLFWQTYLYDRDLKEGRKFAGDIYSCSFRGEIAFGDRSAFNVNNGAVMATLPIISTVQAVAGDQTKLFQFNPTTRGFSRTLMSTIAPVPPPIASGQPPNNSVQLTPVARLAWEEVASALKYRVYFGTDAAFVAAATPSSALYLGETLNAFWEMSPASITLDGQYFWRVDAVGLTATTTGNALSFGTLPVTVSPLEVNQRSITGAPPQSIFLTVSGGSAGTAWTASTAGAAWLTVVTPGGVTGDNLELRLTPGSLPAGDFTGSVTLSAGGQSVVIPVKYTIEALAYTALLADPARPRLYALQRPANLTGSLVVINSTTSAMERVIPLSNYPTGFDLTPDGQSAYVITAGGRKMHRINLTDWSTTERALAASIDQEELPAYRVAAGSGSMVYWVDGEGTPKLHSLDFATGLETGPAILAEGGRGFGSIARNAAGTRLAALTQSGSSSSAAVNVNTSGISARVDNLGLVMSRDPQNYPVLVRMDGSGTFMNSFKIGPGLTQSETEYPSVVYAITPQRGIVFGENRAWRENTGNQIWHAAGASTQICAVTGDASAFYYFNTVSRTLVRVAMSSIGDLPGPQPEDGEVVHAMPATLAWSPKAGASRYEVYFGTDPAAVLAANGTGSPLFLGSPATATLPVNLPFRTGGVWWWRVDTVQNGNPIKGPVWKFSGALSYSSLIKGSNVGFSFSTLVPPSLAMEGTTILSGYGSFASVPGSSTPAGQVLVHTKRRGMEEWEMIQRIDKPAPASAEARFGSAIAMKGDIAWISAPTDGTGGRIYEYRKDSTTQLWQATGRTLQSPAPVAGDGFGTSLAFDGTVIAVGLPNTTVTSRPGAGVVEIFDATSLARHVRITEATAESNSRFGSILAIENGIMAVASPLRTVSGTRAGAIDIWTRGSGTSWSRSHTIPCPTPASNRGFGSALALSGDRLFAGTSSQLSEGKVFSFQKSTGTTWTLLTQIPRAGAPRTDSYTSRLALHGDLLAIGAPFSAFTTPPIGGDVWLHRNLGTSGWTAVAPALPGSNKSLESHGVTLALTKRYLATAYQADANDFGGFTVHLHDAAANLPPYLTSTPVVFAEVGRPYQYTLTGGDENAGDILTVSAATVLPAWLSLTPSGNGRALLSGTPPVGSAGDPAIRLRLQDPAGDSAEQSFILRLQPPGGIPQITATSGDQNLDDGGPVSFRVTVGPGAPVTYQWYHNDTPLSGQTGATLVIDRGQVSDAGSYEVRVTRDGIWVDSPPMSLTINQVPDRFGGDWPTFGATTSHAGSYPATLGQHKFLPAWTIPQTGSNPVVTGGGRIYSVQGSGFAQGASVSAYAPATGIQLWTTALPVSFSVNPSTYFRGKIYMQRGKNTSDTPDLRCFDAPTGRLEWTSTFGAQWEAYFAPTVDDTGIFINGGGSGGLYGFGLDGTERFFNSNLPQLDRWTPLLHQGKLYSWVSGSFINHDRQSGTANYSLTGPGMPQSNSMNTVPAAEGNLAVMRSTTEVFTVDLATRRVLWSKAGIFSGSPALKNGIAYVIGAAGIETFNALTGTAGRVYPTRGTNNAAVIAVHQPVLLDDTLMVSSENLLWTFDLASGALLQRLTGGGALTYSDGILLASGTDATLRAWKVNQPVRLTGPAPAMAAVEDVPFQWELQVTDPDADVPNLTITGLPAWLRAAPLQQGVVRFTGTPLNANAGPFSVRVVADDLKSFPATLQIDGFATAVNDRPIATTSAVERLEDAPTEELSLTDLFSDEETADSDLRYSIVSHAGGVVEASLESPADTTLRITYPLNVFGQALLTVRATDPEGLFADSVITITVAPVNDTPAGLMEPLVRDEDAAAVDLNLDEFFSDIETASSALTFQAASTNPAIATASLTGRVLRITPQPNAFGVMMVNIRCQDPEGAFVDFPLPVTLGSINDLPTGGVADLAVDEDFLPVVVDLAMAFDDIETADSGLRFTAVSADSAVVQTSLSGSLLTLTPRKDANGSLFVGLTCTDEDGGRREDRFNLLVRPVNDPPVIPSALPALSAGDSAPDAVIDFSPFVFDPDAGEVLTWRVVSNTNPRLFTRIEFDALGRLAIEYAPYVSGQAVVTVEVTDQAGTSAQRSFTVDLPALPAPSLVTTSALAVNRQTGLWEQRITVRNTAQRAIGGFEISVTGLPAGTTLYNASGTRPPAFIVGYYQPIAAGGPVAITLEYYAPGRAVVTPVLSTAVMLPRDATLSAMGNEIRIDRMQMLEPGAFLLEFTAIPGELYQVQYSTGGAWADCPVRVRAAGNRVQWIDRGVPRTPSPPMPGKPRFYRVKRLAGP